MWGINYADALLALLLSFCAYLVWLWHRERRRLRRNEWRLSSSQLFHCDQCHYSFIPEEPVTLTRCPRCNTICIKRKNP